MGRYCVCRSLNVIVAQLKNCPFGVELTNITTTSNNIAIQWAMYLLTSVRVLSDIVVMFLSSIVVLTLRRRIKSHLLFAGIIRSSPFSPR